MSIHLLSFRFSSPVPVRLDEFLSRTLPPELEKITGSSDTSKSKIRRLIVAGVVSIDGNKVRRAEWTLKKGAAVHVRLDTEKFSFERQNGDIAFELTAERILFEDDSIIVIDKPALYPTEATIVGSRDHLHAAVKRFLALRDGTRRADIEPYVGLHHRLDRDTSGVILFSKQRTVNAALHRIFLEHLAEKRYQALTGRPVKLPSTEFSVDNCLARISPKSAPGKWGAVLEGGEKAHTDFTLIGTYQQGLHIEARPLTGRTHQIRVHLASLGLPLLGDALYGGSSTLNGGIVPHTMLHAASLSFPHPCNDTLINVSAPLPDDFLNCLRVLEKKITL